MLSATQIRATAPTVCRCAQHNPLSQRAAPRVLGNPKTAHVHVKCQLPAIRVVQDFLNLQIK